MNTQTVTSVISCLVVVGGVLIYIGRSLSALQQLTEGLKVVFAKTDRHDIEIARLDKELAKIQTRQEDCEKCPS